MKRRSTRVVRLVYSGRKRGGRERRRQTRKEAAAATRGKEDVRGKEVSYMRSESVPSTTCQESPKPTQPVRKRVCLKGKRRHRSKDNGWRGQLESRATKRRKDKKLRKIKDEKKKKDQRSAVSPAEGILHNRPKGRTAEISFRLHQTGGKEI